MRNIRPTLPHDTASTVLHSQHTYLALGADLSEAWQQVGIDGLDKDLIDAWKANGVRIGTMDLVRASRFMEKLPGNYGVVGNSQAVTNDPLLLETTPWTERKFELGYTASTGASRTLDMPAGLTRLIIDFQITKDGATLRMVPQHHWYEVSVQARTPQEKLLDGRLFADLAMNAKLTPEQVLVLAYEPPPVQEKPEKKAPPAAGGNERPSENGAAPIDAVTSPPPVIPDVLPPPPAAADAITGPDKPPLPTLGTMLLTGERAGRRLQIVVLLYVPPQGESASPTPQVRPELETP